MKLLITGGGGFLGARLARTLLRRGTLAGQSIDKLVLTDIAPPPADLTASLGGSSVIETSANSRCSRDDRSTSRRS